MSAHADRALTALRAHRTDGPTRQG
jgi:hypothetical protein